MLLLLAVQELFCKCEALKATVLYELSIQAALSSVVDLRTAQSSM